MKARVVAMAVIGLFISAAMALAAFCPICFQAIPDGEKYCSRHKQEMVAKSISTTDEAKVVAGLDQARAQYRQQLETLKAFYEQRGNAANLKKVEAEIKDYDAARHVAFVNWEDSIPAPEAKEANADADKLLADADAMKKGTGLLGIVKSKRMGEAAGVYREILTKYPTSTAVEPAAYALGDYYSSGDDKHYARAVKFYEMCYLSNPATTRDALMRAASVCEDDLGDRENAARYYWMVAYGKTAASAIDGKKAELHLKGLQKGGFGASYKLEEKTEEAKPLPPVVPPK